MGRWEHNCDPAWLQARKKYVTATELRDLRATYNKATKAELACEKVNKTVAGLWADKQASEIVTYSSGPAARGHILEGYAVEECNKIMDTKFVWWDDTLIHSGFLAFSPDALDIPQPLDSVSHHYSELREQPRHMLEIKSYGHKNHAVSCMTKLGSHHERYQLAGAMLVCPTIEDAVLFFYNPDMKHACHPFLYTRKDLEKEIEELREIQGWVHKQFQLCASELAPTGHIYTEQDIYNEYLEAQRLDASFTIK